MSELDIVHDNIIKSIDVEIYKLKSKNNYDKYAYFNQFTRLVKINYARNGKYASDSPCATVTKFNSLRKPRGIMVDRIIKPRTVSDFSPKYLQKLRALLPILKEADDITDKALLDKIIESGIDFKERQSVGNAIYNLVALGNVIVKMNGRVRESLTVLKSEL